MDSDFSSVKLLQYEISMVCTMTQLGWTDCPAYHSITNIEVLALHGVGINGGTCTLSVLNRDIVHV